MLSNAYFLAKFRFDTAENEPAKNLQIFRKMHFRKMHFRKMHFPRRADVIGVCVCAPSGTRGRRERQDPADLRAARRGATMARALQIRYPNVRFWRI